jgi:hypothetical protein
MCFVFIWEQTTTFATYSINWLVFITEMKSVYCAVRTGSLNKAICSSSLMCLIIGQFSDSFIQRNGSSQFYQVWRILWPDELFIFRDWLCCIQVQYIHFLIIWNRLYAQSCSVFGVLKMKVIKIPVFFDMTPCVLVNMKGFLATEV